VVELIGGDMFRAKIEHGNYHILTAALMIAGNTIGAGLLGFPILTGLAGFIPALIGLTFIWILMWATGYILANRLTLPGREVGGLPSLYYNDIGMHGKVIAIIGYLINYYGIMVAYLSGASEIAIKLLPAGWTLPPAFMTLIFFALFTTFTLFGVEVVRHGNMLFMGLLFISFVTLIILASDQLDLSRLKYTDWTFFPATIPIILVAFTYHNTVPVACHILDFNRKSVHKALFIGTLVPWLLTMVWTMTVVGTLPIEGVGKNTLLFAFQHNFPATIPMARILASPYFLIISMIFALLAIITSYVAVGTGLLGFMKDLTRPILPFRNRFTDAIFAFGPPLAITLIYPNLFLNALNIAGGVGISIVFGLLPGIILLKISKGHKVYRTIGLILTLFFFCVLLLELAQEAGLLSIHPAVEHWTAPLKK